MHNEYGKRTQSILIQFHNLCKADNYLAMRAYHKAYPLLVRTFQGMYLEILQARPRSDYEVMA